MLKRLRTIRVAVLPCAALVVAALAGCSIHVDKNEDGHDKKVNIDTPLGGIHVNTNKPQGSTGIDAYPGAQLSKDHDGDKDADVQLGLGSFRLRVQVEHYTTPDDRDKVIAFYRKALARYGGVLECHGSEAVGPLKKTPEGLTCSDQDKHVHVDTGNQDLTLRAGSRKRQHIVGIEKPSGDTSGPTSFALIAVELPSDGNWKGNLETD